MPESAMGFIPPCAFTETDSSTTLNTSAIEKIILRFTLFSPSC
jgi:hypothetical protein